jgi:uncharacterized protein
MRLQRFRDHQSRRWHNGGGITREVIAWPTADAWTWRVSIDDITDDGELAVFGEVDRLLVVTSGAGLVVRIGAGSPVDVMRFESVTFDGGVDVQAALVDGPVQVLDVKVRRTQELTPPTVNMERIAKGHPLVMTNPAAVAIVVDGAIELTTTGSGFPFNPSRERVTRGDALFADAPTGNDRDRDRTASAMVDSVVAVVTASR